MLLRSFGQTQLHHRIDLKRYSLSITAIQAAISLGLIAFFSHSLRQRLPYCGFSPKAMWSKALLSALVFVSLAVAFATQAPFQQSYSATSVLACNISIPVDHFNSSNVHTYTNRYWLNDAYYQPGSPVLFHDFGEAGVTDSSAAGTITETEDTTTVTVELAKRFNGLIIGWEHRFYGESLPFPLHSSSGIFEGGVDAYRYLTVEQALEDVVYFAKHFAPPGCTPKLSQYLSPSKTPWIWIGGSYPGTRGAFLRLRNPQVFYAEWASSATVQARTD